MKLHEDLIKYNRLSAETKILQESYHTEGLLKGIIDGNMENLKKFGQVVKDVAKLVGNDIGFMAQFLDPRLKSWKTWDKRREEHDEQKRALVDKLKVSTDAFDSGDALTKFCLNPGGWAFGVSMKASPHHLFSKDNREAIGKYGADKIPGVGWIFESTKYGDRKSSPFQKFVESCDPEDPDPKAVMAAFAAWQKDPMGWAGSENTGDPETKLGFLKNLLIDAQKLFLITDSVATTGNIIQEGDEEDENEVGELDDYPKLKKMVAQVISNYLDENWPLDRDKFIKNHKKYYDLVISDSSKTLALIGTMSSTEDAEAFFKALSDLKKLREDFDINIDDMKEKFTKSVEAVKENEEAMAKIKEDAGDEEISEDDLNKKLGAVVLTGFKSQFLMAVKNNITEFYESLYNQMSGDLEEEQMKDMANEYDKQFLELTTDYRNKLTQAISNFKQS